MIAALAVYASHVGPPHGASGGLKAFIEAGYMGVTLFFVLSGFVLTINYFDRLRHPTVQGVWRFGVARFARIYPLYILILFYLLVRQHVFGGGISGWWEHVLVIQAWDPNIVHTYSFDGPAWSVSVECFLYASFPVLILALARLRTPRGMLLTAIAVVVPMFSLAAWFVLTSRSKLSWLDPQSAHHWLYVLPVTRLGDFVLGILAARLYVQVRGRPRVTKAGVHIAAFAALLIVVLMAWPANLYSAWSWDVAYAIPSVMVIFGLAVSPTSVPARVLSLPAFILLGESSYAFYLVHQPALEYFGAGRWTVALSVSTVAYEIMTLGAIICLAIGLHIAVERPARIYIRRLATYRSRRTQERSTYEAGGDEQLLVGEHAQPQVVR